jgi:hypothetical protein
VTEPRHDIDTLRAYTDAAIQHAANVSAISLAAAEKLTGQRFSDQQIAVDAAFAAQKEAIAAALAAQEKAVTKAELAAERRFEGVNEFRGQLSDQAATFMSRAEALLQMQTNADKIDALGSRMDRTEGRSTGLNAGWVILVTAVATLGVIVTLLLKLR